jgi:hypothetical protein
MDEAEQIRRFIAERGITRCPPRKAAAPSTRRPPPMGFARRPGRAAAPGAALRAVEDWRASPASC